ncbi:alpha/beta fold hydrolase [Dactylosporangium sp. CA-233914]|uniref:alpha/beta fold hydrolase n=1 Tax=Dactylosporangium sp. CA-233914 TaxID=3239934 RepID=UPI003D91E4F4
MTQGFVTTEGADIVFDAEGAGPLLLLISGGGGDAARYKGVSSLLSDKFTVVRYDRRGNHRSGGDRHADLDVAQQARDAAAIIRHVGQQALVFGNSGGAIIALQLAVTDPQLVRAVVAHEPPLLSILPDAAQWFAYQERIYDIFEAEGPLQAMHVFTSDIVGAVPVDPSTDAGDYSGKPADDWEFFMRHEFLQFTRPEPDVDALASSPLRIALAVGLESGDVYYTRTARVLAEKATLPVFEMPGNHTPHNLPAMHAAALRAVMKLFV